ncbi:hypothetical protein PVK06_003996 [Gossypium arboreum]|uniref:Uncharacterized protein n=1 Tax=Gossypium arboreum TaxID=29729 RepID=A0ABR0QQR9_GOSAR|nr:hypothetical protein PVK06_003996 [Gossypium arboreum]
MVWRNSSPEKSLFHQLRCVIVKVNWLKMKPMNGTFSKTVLLPHGCFYCKSHLLSQLVAADTSKDIWSTLLRLFSTMSTTKICDTLAASGNSLSEIEYVATILNGLPVEYGPFIAVIAASREPVSLEGVCSILVDAERRNLILQCHSLPGVSSSSYRPPRPVPATNMCAFTSAVPVFLDNVLPSYGSSITMSADRSVLEPLVQSSTTQAIQLDPSVSATWFIDSKATHHVTNESQAFSAGYEYVGKGKFVVVFAFDQLCTYLIP